VGRAGSYCPGMRIVVTGAGGYVGGRLVQHLGAAAVPTLRTPKPWLPGAVVADLLHDDLGPLLDGADAVVHLAGASEVRFGADPERSRRETATATERVATAARAAGARLVYLSTFQVYGPPSGVIDERTPAAPVNDYGRSRLEGEAAAAALGPDHTVSLRLTNSLGPPAHPDVDRWTLVANVFCRTVAGGGDLAPHDGGRALRDFVDLGEACRVIAAAAGGDLPAGPHLLGSGTTTSVLDLAHLVADAAEEVLGRRPAVAPQPPSGPDPVPFRVSVEGLARHVPPPDPDLRPALVGTLRLLA
jgi:nucleoside-diphosphate-sugar epimerase